MTGLFLLAVSIFGLHHYEAEHIVEILLNNSGSDFQSSSLIRTFVEPNRCTFNPRWSIPMEEMSELEETHQVYKGQPILP